MYIPKWSSKIVNIIERVLFSETPSLPNKGLTLKMLILRPLLEIAMRHKLHFSNTYSGQWPPPPVYAHEKYDSSERPLTTNWTGGEWLC